MRCILSSISNKAMSIRCLVLDLDGVLTDAGIYLNQDGIESRRFNINDGFGLKLLQSIGFSIAIITGSSDDIVAKRMAQIGISHFYTKAMHKLNPYEDLKTKLDLADHEIAFMGDDYQDIVLLKRVGLSIAPANAIDAVKQRVDIITKAKGGHGAVREICEFFIKLHNKENDIIDYFDNYPCQTLNKVF
jgi:3-deoxy-D-manno-octulosonate 8-phosphate phosphatase (KDO 8-P phosphatase)